MRRIFGSKRDEVTGSGVKHIMRILDLKLHSSYLPVYGDGTDRMFRNVGI